MNEINDIVSRVQAAKGDAAAADIMIQEYLPFIKAQASKTIGYQAVSEQDDVFCVAMFAFHQAIEAYSRTRGSFLNFTGVVIKRKIIDYQRKEKRHLGHLSLQQPTEENEALTRENMLQDDHDVYEEIATRDATREELKELKKELETFGLTLSDIADNSPKQARTLQACKSVLQYTLEHKDLLEELKRTKRLPIAKLTLGTRMERKTLERHRKYLIALLVIYSNGYAMIRGHLKQVLQKEEGPKA